MKHQLITKTNYIYILFYILKYRHFLSGVFVRVHVLSKFHKPNEINQLYFIVPIMTDPLGLQKHHPYQYLFRQFCLHLVNLK